MIIIVIDGEMELKDRRRSGGTGEWRGERREMRDVIVFVSDVVSEGVSGCSGRLEEGAAWRAEC